MGRASQRRLVQCASRQFGLVTAADVAGCRVSRGWMQRRMETGEWSRIYRGVFRLGANASLDAQGDRNEADGLRSSFSTACEGSG